MKTSKMARIIAVGAILGVLAGCEYYGPEKGESVVKESTSTSTEVQGSSDKESSDQEYSEKVKELEAKIEKEKESSSAESKVLIDALQKEIQALKDAAAADANEVAGKETDEPEVVAPEAPEQGGMTAIGKTPIAVVSEATKIAVSTEDTASDDSVAGTLGKINRENGEACDSILQCTSGFCESGICVASKEWCSGSYQTIQGKDCVCGDPAVVATSDPVNLKDGTPRCVRTAQDVILKVQTGDFADAGPGDHQFDFVLCPTQDFTSKQCFKARFGYNNPQGITLATGSYETIDFGLQPSSQIKSTRHISDLKYPDDFQYFRISSAAKTDNAWLLAGVELKVQLKGGSGDTFAIYRNPCVNRWIQKNDGYEGGNGDHTDFDHYSPHSIKDDVARCFYIETADAGDAGANDYNTFIDMGLKDSLPEQTVKWLKDYNGNVDDDAPVPTLKSGKIELMLNWGSSDTGYDDFERNDAASYGTTIYQGKGHLKLDYTLRFMGSQQWKVHRVKAYHIRPGDKEFLENQECWFSDMNLDPNDRAGGKWMADEKDGDVVHTIKGPTMTQTTCPSLTTVKWYDSKGKPNSNAFGTY